MRVRRAISDCDHDQDIRVMSVCAERFGAVEYPGIASADGGHTRAAGVGAGGRLGQSPRTDEFPGCQLRNVFFLLNVICGQENMIRAQ